ncbi:MAG TPA: hypothetical protein VN420_00355 [Candidatus Fimivivens sp.]|nr:hypothetical protein [Candidatus Fimivivens sp.]
MEHQTSTRSALRFEIATLIPFILFILIPLRSVAVEKADSTSWLRMRLNGQPYSDLYWTPGCSIFVGKDKKWILVRVTRDRMEQEFSIWTDSANSWNTTGSGPETNLFKKYYRKSALNLPEPVRDLFGPYYHLK